MGFKLPVRTATLVFEGEYAGAEVITRLDVPIGLLIQLMDLKVENPTAQDGLKVYELFVKEALISWNLEDAQGQSIPGNVEGLRALTPAFANLMISKWAEVVANPPSPLSEQSRNGSMLAEAQMPTAKS